MHTPALNRSLTVEGWRGINHSFALVNQFQLLELAQTPGLDLGHVDAPFHFAHWSRAANGAGFKPNDEAILERLRPPSTATDWTYRIFSPLDLRPSRFAKRLAVFAVTELGLDAQSLTLGSDIAEFEAAGHILVTPSQWSRERIIDFGFNPDTVHVIPHAVSSDYFFPMADAQIQQQRSALGFKETDVLLLNIGAAIWNKGIDVLLTAFALARQKRHDLRLIFKDQRNTYGISGETFVQTTLANAGLLSNDVLNAITLIPSNLDMAQMNSMYGIADCYVSPYRAEGFNLPVLEAMACGVPVIVTDGGATDDFVSGSMHRKVGSTLHQNTRIQDKDISGYREPHLDQLVEMLLQTHQKQPHSLRPDTPIGWKNPVNQLLTLLA
jgi:glycosyltransferase involved in cell wall biosynthesis